ncbi:MAG: hypothetical protein ACJ75H_03730 [Thermoanaerobaculia bacterium]
MNEPITIQHLDEASADWIEAQASRRGVDKEQRDLESLAGTWSEEDAEEFERVTEPLRQVDEELWR